MVAGCAEWYFLSCGETSREGVGLTILYLLSSSSRNCFGSGKGALLLCRNKQCRNMGSCNFQGFLSPYFSKAMWCLALGIFLANFFSAFGAALMSSQALQRLLSTLTFSLLPMLSFCSHCIEKVQFLMCKKTTALCALAPPSPWAVTVGIIEGTRTLPCWGTEQVAKMAFCLYGNCRIRTGLQRELPI